MYASNFQSPCLCGRSASWFSWLQLPAERINNENGRRQRFTFYTYTLTFSVHILWLYSCTIIAQSSSNAYPILKGWKLWVQVQKAMQKKLPDSLYMPWEKPSIWIPGGVWALRRRSLRSDDPRGLGVVLSIPAPSTWELLQTQLL